MLTRMILISWPHDPPTLASQSAGIIGVSHHAQPPSHFKDQASYSVEFLLTNFFRCFFFFLKRWRPERLGWLLMLTQLLTGGNRLRAGQSMHDPLILGLLDFMESSEHGSQALLTLWELRQYLFLCLFLGPSPEEKNISQSWSLHSGVSQGKQSHSLPSTVPADT